VSFIKKGASAFGKLISVVILVAAFLVGMVGVMYMSLQGKEIKVPEIVGKNLDETEKELEALGLRVKKRAERYSEEAPNTILEQLPKPGDTVKTGQMILVVISKPNADGEEKPMTIQKGDTKVEDDSERIEELITDKPKKKESNSNTNANKKKTSTTRDVVKSSNTSSNTLTESKSLTDDSKTPGKENKETSAPPTTTKTPVTATPKPTTARTPTNNGETRERRSQPR
jgi:beta-lactam-binding protein with PASTA domain